jgi:two-component system chemotaxis sensor kinase CheA
MTLTGELILARNQAMQQLAGTPVPASFGATAQRLHALSTALQENVMKTRMLPIGNIFAKLPRVVRDVATALGKDVRTELDGEGTELDRTLIEAIKDPLTHLVRNAIDHGVEDPATRRARGKPAQGTVSLRAYHAGGQVNVEIADDGNGIDCEKIRKKAVALGTLSAEAARDASERELLPLIFAPGFSTAERVTSVSGRGVGLDVVKTHIERIGGMVDVKTSAGKGTTIHLRIPLTLAIVPSLIVSSAGARFAIPQANLVELVRAPALRMESFHGVSVYRLRGRLLPLVVLSSVLGERAAPAGDTVNIVVLQTRERPFGLVVDEIHDTDDIVVKPLGAHFRGIAAFSGATILGDGDVALILDVAAVAAAGGAVGEIVEGAGRAAPAVVSASEESLLLCRSAGDGVVAIRLGAVRRLDRIPVASIERTGDEEVVQYHGEIMPLRRLSALLGDASVADDDDKLDVVVIGSIGVVVSQILDIVHCDATVQRRSTRLGVVGSLVVNGRVTELLDVCALLQTSGLRLAAPAVAA